MKVIKASIENFKDIEARTVDMNGRSMVVMGKNGAGKSSLLQAIQSPLNKKVTPIEPIKEGEESAKIDLQLAGEVQGVEKNFSVEVRYQPSNKKGQITVYDAEGQKVASGRKAVEDLFGYISFDPFEFARKGVTTDGNPSKKGVEEQVDLLKRFLSQEELDKLKEAEASVENAVEQRKQAKAKQKDLDKEVEQTELSQEEIEKYQEHKDEQLVLDKLNQLDKEIEKYNRIDRKLSEKKQEKERSEQEIKEHVLSAEENIREAVQKQRDVSGGSVKDDLSRTISEHVNSAIKESLSESGDEGLDQEILKGAHWLQNNEKPSNEKLMEELESIREHNRKMDEVKRKQKVFQEARDNKELVKQYEEQVKVAEENKKKVFESSSLPVDGLSFDEDKVLYHGKPFNENQIPTSELIKVGAHIGMGLNKNIRLITIKDGSLLDESSLQELLSIVQEHDYQLIVERVSDQEDLTVEYVESDL